MQHFNCSDRVLQVDVVTYHRKEYFSKLDTCMVVRVASCAIIDYSHSVVVQSVGQLLEGLLCSYVKKQLLSHFGTVKLF